MKITREEAIRLHIEMWKLVADACKKKGSAPLKHLDVADVEEAVIRKMLFKMGEREQKKLAYDSFCCEYIFEKKGESCSSCPIDWGGGHICCSAGFFTAKDAFWYAKSWEEAALWAEIIAQLPERKVYKSLHIRF